MSLTARVSAFFLATLGIVLLGFSVSLYVVARAYLHRQMEERLESALDTLAATAEKEDDGLEWKPEDHHLTLGRDSGPEQVRWEVREGSGRLKDRSANLDQDGFAGASGTQWQFARRTLRASPNLAPTSFPPNRYAVLELTAGLSPAPLEATLRALSLTLAGLSLAVWLASAALGRWMCRRALAPVTRMAAAARSMTADDFGRPLPSPGTADELADLHRAFNDLLDRMREAFERQQRFTGDASHQLRTPLTVMLGHVELALRRDRPAEEYRAVLDRIHGQAMHLRRIVEALLFLARADAESGPAASELLDLAAWLPTHLRTWEGRARTADLRLDCSEGEKFLARVHPVLLGQLLDNLLDNAFKYSGSGTPVAVALRREGDAVALSVEDGGYGIPADDLPHIFEPFYRSADVRRRGRAGVGLGLATAQRIAIALGGHLRAESTPGRGSRFTLSLHAASPREASGQPGISLPTAESR